MLEIRKHEEHSDMITFTTLLTNDTAIVMKNDGLNLRRL